jgi:uncharacterized protein (TIGR00661 family)
MRILYGVHGYGRGHATRTLAVLPYLAAYHRLLVVCGGDAYQAIQPEYPAVRIPTLGFAYGQVKGPQQRSNWRTLRQNLPSILDLFLRGPVFQMVAEIVADFAPDVVISDAETWTHKVAAYLRVPRISFDHMGILAYCRPRIAPRDRIEAMFDTACYRLLMGRPERVIVSSFYPAPARFPGARVVGPLPRQAVRELTPRAGDHLLAYFNRGDYQLSEPILQTLQAVGCPVHIYGTSRRGRLGRLSFLPPSGLPFLEDLAACRAVVSTAGNQLVGEALYLQKPLLVMPERCVEQRLNAAAVERLGIGIRLSPRRLSAERIRDFLQRRDEFVANMQSHVRDGLPESLEAIEEFLHELVSPLPVSGPSSCLQQTAPP